MKLRFWLFVCALAMFFGCANDAGVERVAKRTSAITAVATSITVTLTPTPVAYGDPFTFTWALSNPGLATGSVSFTSAGVSLHDPAPVDGGDANGAFDVNSASLPTRNVCATFNDPAGKLLAQTCQDVSVIDPPPTTTSLAISAVADSQRTQSFTYGEGIHVQYSVSAGQVASAGLTPIIIPCDGCQFPQPPPINGTMHLSYAPNVVIQTAETGIPLKDCPVADGEGSCDITNPGPWVPVGQSWRIIGTFEPAVVSDWQGSSWSSDGFSVSAASTTTNIASSDSATVIDAAAHFNVEVSPVTPSTAPPTGSVTLYIGRTAISSAATLNPDANSGVSSVTVTVTDPALVHTAGSKLVHAIYTPDVPDGVANFTGSTSADFTHVVADGGTIRTLTSDPAAWTFGTSATLTLTVDGTDPNAGTPTGTVTFYEGQNPEPTSQLGTSTLGPSNGHQIATLTTTMSTLGQRTILAVYSGDAKHIGGSATITQMVARAIPTMQLLIDHTSAVFSTPVVFGATLGRPAGVSDTVALPTGTVHFYYVDGTNDVPFGSDADLGTVGAASITNSLIPVAAGQRTIKVKYSGDSFYQPTEATNFLTIDRDPTTLVLRTSKDPATVTTTVTFTATVSKTGTATAVPKGSVGFAYEDGPLGVVPLDASGVAALDVSTLPLGEHTITAIYDGGSNWVFNVGELTQHIDTAAVTTNLTSSANPARVGTAVTFTATFGSTDVGPATGNVELFDGETSLGTRALASGSASITVSDLAAGVHPIRATYAGDGTHAAGSASLSQVMTRIATTTTLSTTAAASTEYGAGVPLKATVTSASGVPSGTIAFTDGATILGFATVDAAGTATFTANLLGVGPHSFSAQYFGAATFEPSSSTPVAHTVTKVSDVLTLVSSSNPSPLSFSVKFTATVSGVAPGVTPNGTVTFREGTTTLGSGSLGAGGVATFSTSTLAAGAHVITASYAGDAHFNAADSAPLTQTVSATAAAMTLASSPNPSTTGQEVTISATLAGTLGTPTGTVTFKQGTTTLGSAPIDGSGKASISTSTLPVGTLNLTAEYAGDVHYGAGTASAAHVVKKIPTTISLGASPTHATVGTAISFTVTVSSPSGSATGDVELFDGTTSLGSQTLAGGLATFSISSLTEGLHAVTALYKGTATLAEGKSNTITITVTTEPTGIDAGAGTDAGTGQSSGGTGSSSSSGSTPPPAGAADAGASSISTTGGLNVNPGGGGSGDDCAMMPGETGTATVPVLLGLVFILARRRRKVAA